MSAPVVWIESTSWELPFFGLPSRIPWPSEVDPAEANKDPFEIDHLLRALELLGPDAGEPWVAFGKAAVHFEDLAEALEDAEIVRARDLLTEVERLHPGTSFQLFHMAYVARHEGRDADALALYQAAAEKTPTIGAIWNNLGILHSTLGQRDQAIASFHRALQYLPNDSTALEGLAGLRAVVKLMGQKPDGSSAPAYVDIATFRKMTSEQIPQLAEQPDQLLGFGEQLLRDGIVPDVGLAALEKAREVRPNDPRTLLSLSAAYRVGGQPEKAKEAASKVTELFPNEAAGFFNLAQVCNTGGDSAGERAALERVLELDPNAQAALGIHFGLAPGEHDPLKEEQLGKFGEERRSWMAFLLASNLTKERGDTQRAMRWAERAMEIQPDSEEVLLHYTALLGDARDLAKLASVVKPQVESGRFSKRLDWNYAQVLRQLGLHQDAITILKKAASGEVPDDFKNACLTTIHAWSGLLAGTGIPLEVHRSGFLQRPVVLTLADGDGGVVLSAGAKLPADGSFAWRAQGGESTVMLQQGHTGSATEPRVLGTFKVRGVQAVPEGPTVIDCHVKALPDGALHFQAVQNGRALPVMWTPAREKLVVA